MAVPILRSISAHEAASHVFDTLVKMKKSAGMPAMWREATTRRVALTSPIA
jgi:hypothetical protein